MNFVAWPDCDDKSSRSVHTVNNLMHNAMQIHVQPLVLGSVDTIAVSWKFIVC